jgi:hypothetical protein
MIVSSHVSANDDIFLEQINLVLWWVDSSFWWQKRTWNFSKKKIFETELHAVHLSTSMILSSLSSNISLCIQEQRVDRYTKWNQYSRVSLWTRWRCKYSTKNHFEKNHIIFILNLLYESSQKSFSSKMKNENDIRALKSSSLLIVHFSSFRFLHFSSL